MDAVGQPVRYEYTGLLPLLPLFSLVSFLCCMLVLPTFIKTRVVALITFTCWLALGNLLICINLCIWRNNTRNIPIYSDVVAQIWCMYTVTIYLNIFCFHKFVWNMTRQGASVRIYDKRKEYNRLDLLLTVFLPVLWIPINVLTLHIRYEIIEDVGPMFSSPISLESALVRSLPVLPITIASVCFLVLTLNNVWSTWHMGPMRTVAGRGHLFYDRSLTTKKAIKYLCLLAVSLLGLIFGCIWTLLPLLWGLREEYPWYTKSSIRDNIRQLLLIRVSQGYHPRSPDDTGSAKGFFITIPVMGIVPFLFFGLGPEALKGYRARLQALSNILKLPLLCSFLRTRQSRLGWLTRRVLPVEQEYFAPFESNDILLDSYSFVLPDKLGMLHAQALSTQPTIDPPSSRVPLPKIQLGVHRLAVPSQEWYRKEPIITPLHPNRQPPTSLQLRPTPEELSNFPGRWRVHRKEPISTSPAPLKSINPLSALF